MTPHDLQLTIRFNSDKEAPKLPADDDDIAFLVQAYKDKRLAVNCLESIRKCYPVSRIILVLDGDEDPDWTAVASRFGAEKKHQERLYLLPRIGEMGKKSFEYWLEKPTPFLIKLDTDSIVRRRFRYLPDAEAFGSLACFPDGSFSHIVGGFTGFSRLAVERMLAMRVFDDAGLCRDVPDWISRCSASHWKEWCVKGGRGSYDCMISHVCVKHGVRIEVFDEVYSTWWPVPKSAREKYAVTHPHKT
jgi:hypothetical protein